MVRRAVMYTLVIHELKGTRRCKERPYWLCYVDTKMGGSQPQVSSDLLLFG
jgi:hypothetical protein